LKDSESFHFVGWRNAKISTNFSRYPRFEVVVTFIWQIDEIAALARWSDREWVLNVADLVGGHVAPFGRWICTRRVKSRRKESNHGQGGQQRKNELPSKSKIVPERT